MDPRDAINKMDTGDLNSGGLLLPEQVKTFYQMVFDIAPFSQMCRKLRMSAKVGEIDKIAIGSRILRGKTEVTGPAGYAAATSFGKVDYTCARLCLPWEVSEDAYHDNIEGQGLEDRIMGMMTTQLCLDLEDLHWNSDSADNGADKAFLNLNNGWLKQIRNGGHVVTASAINGGKFTKDHLFAMYKAMPAKYFRTGNVKWCMNQATKIAWVEMISSRATGAGDLALLGTDVAQKPLGLDIVYCPSIPDGTVVLGDPMNFIIVSTWDVRIRKAAEGKDAVLNDMRYYACFLDDDPVIQELAGTVICEGIELPF
jgi:HK97 family phage major capsid protein